MTRADDPSGNLTLPSSVAAVLDRIGDSRRHPGLQLDKLSPPGNQEAQKRSVEKVCRATGEPELLSVLSKRREDMLAMVGAERFSATTAGPLTLHLARASGLENAGIHLHPVYGFACLPGSGLKGMTRAYAETIWLADQSDPAAAWNDIQAVFGWAVQSEQGKRWKPENVDDAEGSSAGSVVFHDAWPVKWPRLVPDIVNNHHKSYYEGKNDPGDWDKPEMAYFLSVAAGTTFDFALSPRTAEDDDVSRFMALAREWLRAALVHEGAGAKTNAGYGRFRLEGQPSPASPNAARATSTHTLELATPAFLAGAQQQKEDCDLRPATLRGLLRWWWRTMHTAHLSREDLRRLETAVWGDAENGAALALSVGREGRPEVALYDYKNGFKPKQDFARKHGLETPGGKTTTQGLFYASYGMDDGSRDEKRQRYYVRPGPGARWTVVLSARRTVAANSGSVIPPSEILCQGEAALWLLCRYGGVGSKARKGFGSFADIEIAGIRTADDCKDVGFQFRRKAGFEEDAEAKASARSSNLDDMLPLEIETPWRDWWFAMDQLGFAAQSFARRNAHRERKAALGLPRKIHGPRREPMSRQNPTDHQPPRPLHADGRQRHASPIHYHLAPRTDGALTVRMTAFPTPDLPDIDTSRDVLKELGNHLKSELEDRIRKHAKRGTKTPEHRVSPAPIGDQARATDSLPNPGDRVEAVLLEERTRKGGWKAKHEPSGLQGPIQNTASVPSNAASGQRAPLVVALVNPREIAFNWLTPEVEARQAKAGGRRRHRGTGAKQPPRTRR